MADWRKNNRLQLTVPAINRLVDIDKVSGDFKGFKGFGFERQVILLESYAKFQDQIPDNEKYGIIWSACVAAAKKKTPITANSLKTEISRLERSYLSKPEMKYRLFADISIASRSNIWQVYFEGSVVKFKPKLANSAKTKRNDFIQSLAHMYFSEAPKNYTLVSISVSARSKSEALDLAVRRLDFVRGAWNLQGNRHILERYTNGPSQPVNGITLGPIHTLHSSTGGSVHDRFWLDPRYQAPVKPLNDLGKTYRMSEFAKNLLAQYRNLPYKDVYSDALIRYVRALDARDYSVSVIELWAVLEKLTGISNASYGDLVRRAAYPWKDYKEARQALEYIRERRNMMVHSGVSHSQIETILYQLKGFVEVLLLFHLKHAGSLDDMEEAADLLDMSKDANILSKREDRIRLACGYT